MFATLAPAAPVTNFCSPLLPSSHTFLLPRKVSLSLSIQHVSGERTDDDKGRLVKFGDVPRSHLLFLSQSVPSPIPPSANGPGVNLISKRIPSQRFFVSLPCVCAQTTETIKVCARSEEERGGESGGHRQT